MFELPLSNKQNRLLNLSGTKETSPFPNSKKGNVTNISVYNKLHEKSLIKTKDFDEMITDCPSMGKPRRNHSVEEDLSWDVHRFTKYNLKNNHITIEELLDQSPKKMKETATADAYESTNYQFTKKSPLLTKTPFQNTHVTNNSIHEEAFDQDNYDEVAREADKALNALSTMKIKENMTKALASKSYFNQSVDDKPFKNSKTRNNRNNVYEVKSSNKSINTTQATKKTGEVAKQTKTISKLTKNAPRDDNVNINSFNANQKIFSTQAQNRNDALYMFAKVKAENKKNEELIIKEQQKKEELKKCTFQPKVTPVKKLNDLFRAPSQNLVKYLKIQNPKNAKLSYIDRLQTWDKSKKEKKEKKLKQEEEELKIVCPHKPKITQSVPKYDKNKSDFDIAHKKYMNRVISARIKKDEFNKKLNPNFSVMYDVNRRNKNNSMESLGGRSFLTSKQSDLFYKNSQALLHNNLQSFVATYDADN